MRPPFRTTYWRNYPEPFYPGASGQYPIPGWGARPVMAGPARLGVGADNELSAEINRLVFASALIAAAGVAAVAGLGYMAWKAAR